MGRCQLKIYAKDITGREAVLFVRSNPFAILGWGGALYVTEGSTGKKFRYDTLTEFFIDWEVLGSRQHQIPVPFLRDKVGMGTIVGEVLAWFHILPDTSCGCSDRKTWFNWLAAAVPMWGYVEDGIQE